MNKVLKAGTLYVIASFISMLVSFITTPIFSRLLNINDYGIVVTYTSWVSILLTIYTLNVRVSIQQSRYEFKDHNDEYISSIAFLSTITAAVLFLFTYIFCQFVYNFLGIPQVLIIVMLLEIICTNIISIFQIKSRAFFEYKKYTFVSIATTILSPICTLTLMKFADSNSFYVRIIGNLIPILICGIIIGVLILKKGRCLFNKEYWKFAVKFSIPLIPHALSGVILAQFDKILINSLIDSSSVAIYGMAVSIVTIMTMVFQSINQAWSPWWYNQMDSGNFKMIKEMSKKFAIVIAVANFGFMAIVPEALTVLAPSSYNAAKMIIPILSLGSFISFLYIFYVDTEYYYKETMKVSACTLASCLINIITNFIFIPIYGYSAAAYTTLLSYLVLLFLHRHNAKQIEKSDIYPEKLFAVLLIFMTGTSFVFLTLYNYFFIRYVFTFILLSLFLYIFRKDFVDIILLFKKGK